jgi:RHS repeat-associated protein
MLDSVKMIHMNGRVYDRVIGRFLSADPYVSDPSNTQSSNRYSYVLNNPLSLTDPSGFGEATLPYNAPLEELEQLDSLGHRDSPPPDPPSGGLGGFTAVPGSDRAGPGGNGGDTGAIPEIVVIGHKPPRTTPPPLVVYSLLLINPGQLNFPPIDDPCAGSGGSAMAFRNSAPNDPSKPYTPTDTLPPDAMSYVAPNGRSFYAPPAADFVSVYNYGRSLSNTNFPLDGAYLDLASGHGGIFDFQRGNNIINSNYIYAANYAIGILMNGANHSLPLSQGIFGAYKAILANGKGSAVAREAVAQGYGAAASGACSK